MQEMLLIIDLDGTILDSQRQHLNSFIKGLKASGVYVSKELIEKIKSMFGMPGSEILRQAAPELNDAMMSVLVENVSRVLYKDEINNVKLFPDAKSFLEEKSKNHTLVLATSSSRRFTELVLDKFSIRKYFSFVITKDDVLNAKPDPEMINLAAEKSGFSKDDVIFFGDTVYDFEAAKRANVRFVAVIGDSLFRKELIKKAECVENISDFKI